MRTFNGVLITAPVANSTVLPADGKRVGLIISAPSAGFLVVSFGVSSDVEPHMQLVTGAAPLQLWSDDYGWCIQKDVHVTLAGAGQAVITNVIES